MTRQLQNSISLNMIDRCGDRAISDFIAKTLTHSDLPTYPPDQVVVIVVEAMHDDHLGSAVKITTYCDWTPEYNPPRILMGCVKRIASRMMGGV